MFNTELTVVNACLKTLGELRVNGLDEDHSMVPEAREAFALCNVKEQARRWWFNCETITLTRDVDGSVYAPADTIELYPESSSYVQRGRRIYHTGSYGTEPGFNFPEATVRCYIVRLVPYEDLPVAAQNLILYATQLEFMAGYDADSNRYQQITQQYRDAYVTLTADHIRSAKANLFRSPAIGYRLLDIGGNNLNRLRTPGYRGD